YLNDDRTVPNQYFIKFREIDGKYYPEKITRKMMRFMNRDVGGHQMDIHTFWFDEVKTEKLKRIRHRDAQKREQVLEPGLYKFAPEFWKNYEPFVNHTLDSAIIKSLERHRSLNEQFKSNGND